MILAALFLLTAAKGGVTGELRFGPDLGAAGWTIVEYPRGRPAAFHARAAATLDVATDTSAGMLARVLNPPTRTARMANWRWRADEGVGPTDLTLRGKDDRILAVYFIFGRERDVGIAPLQMLASSSVTALAYVFGGNKPRGSIVSSPHMGDRGKFIILRPAGDAKRIWYDETVDLPGDYARAFSRPPPFLIAVAISSDSDDTRGRNRASLSKLIVGH